MSHRQISIISSSSRLQVLEYGAGEARDWRSCISDQIINVVSTGELYHECARCQMPIGSAGYHVKIVRCFVMPNILRVVIRNYYIHPCSPGHLWHDISNLDILGRTSATWKFRICL